MEITKEQLEPSRLTQADVAAFRRRYRHDPVLFCTEILGVDLDDNQRAIAEAVRDHKRVVCVSARGCGKSYALSAIAIWFFVLSPETKVVLGANTYKQSYDVLWLTLIRIVNGSKIASWFEQTNDYLFWKGARGLGFVTRITASADSVESISGFHARNLLYLLDESSGIPDKIILNLIGSMTEENNRILLTTNPTRNTGFTADVCDTDGWKSIHISGYSSRFTNKMYLDEMVRRYGKDSDIVRVHVFGEFPKQSSYAIVTRELLNELIANEKAHAGEVVVGLDVASTGTDLSVWCVRSGGNIVAIETEATSNVDSLIDHTLGLCERWNAERVFVDSTGLGWTIPELLRKAMPHLEIEGVNFGSKSLNERCANMRAFMYSQLADAMKNREIGFAVKDSDLFAELLNTEIVVNSHGKYQLPSKDKTRELLGRSPDRADALALTFATLSPFYADGGFAVSDWSTKDETAMFSAGLWG